MWQLWPEEMPNQGYTWPRAVMLGNLPHPSLGSGFPGGGMRGLATVIFYRISRR